MTSPASVLEAVLCGQSQFRAAQLDLKNCYNTAGPEELPELDPKEICSFFSCTKHVQDISVETSMGKRRQVKRTS